MGAAVRRIYVQHALVQLTDGVSGGRLGQVPEIAFGHGVVDVNTDEPS